MGKQSRIAWVSAWDLLAAAGLALLALIFAWSLPRLPDQVPIHFDAQGHVNGWTDKAQLPWILFGIPAALWLVLWGIGWIGSRAGKDAAEASAAAAHPLRGFLGLGISLLMAGCLLAPVGGGAAMQIGAGTFFLCLVLGIVFMAREMKHFLASQPSAEHYRWGLFYQNPEDPRLWVEKRMGIGWTLNYARRAAWWVTALCLLPVVVMLGLIVLLQK